MKNRKFPFYSCLFLLFATGTAMADEPTVDELPPPPSNNMECIPTIALPVYPEAETCAAYAPDNNTVTSEDNSTDTNSVSNTESDTTTIATPVTQYSTNTTTYYYPYPYYYPENYYYNNNGVFLGLFTGLAIGGLFYAINHDNDNYYNSYYNNYFHNYYYHNNGYKNSWHGENGNAGIYRGPNGGAYYWSANGHEGGGYCYQGTCNHNNNMYKSTEKPANTLTSTNIHTTTHMNSTSNFKPQNINTHKMPSEHFNINRPNNFHFNAGGFQEHGFGGGFRGRR